MPGGARRIKQIIRTRLPERLAGRLPPLLVEFAVGVAIALALVTIRYALDPVVGDRAPYAVNFAAIVVACVLAGWRSGLVALIVGQVLGWLVIVEPPWSFALADGERIAGFVIGTVSQLVMLLVLGLYQREVEGASIDRELRVDLLSEALREIDHRTKNNYQTVLALVQLQAQRAKEPAVKEALQQVADRISAVTLATEKLALRSDTLGTVRLQEHLRELCDQVERGLSRDGVRVHCEIDTLNASSEKAVYVSIIVNELVTNALKHAFSDAADGSIRVSSKVGEDGVAIIVADHGSGFKGAPSRSRGLGMRLVDRFALQLGARHDMTTSEQGTTHRLLVPSLE